MALTDGPCDLLASFQLSSSSGAPSRSKDTLIHKLNDQAAIVMESTIARASKNIYVRACIAGALIIATLIGIILLSGLGDELPNTGDLNGTASSSNNSGIDQPDLSPSDSSTVASTSLPVKNETQTPLAPQPFKDPATTKSPNLFVAFYNVFKELPIFN